MGEVITAYTSIQRVTRHSQARQAHGTESGAEGGSSLSTIWILEAELCGLHLCQ